MPEISIIVPVYKVEKYLSCCIDSILSQTYGDFELILVDDGSPDNSIAICQDYAARDSRIRILRQENQGQSAARNHGLEIARGSYICYVDSDDLVHPQLLEILHRGLTETGAPVSMCGFHEAAEPSGDFFADQDGSFEHLTMNEQTLVSLYDQERYPAWVVWGKLIRRDLIERYPMTEGRVFEDNEAVCHWLCQGGTLARTDLPLYFYRCNDTGTTKSQYSLKKLDYLWALESIILFYHSLGYVQLRQRFLKRYVEAATDACFGTRNLLKQPRISRQIFHRTLGYLRRNKLHLTPSQLGVLLDASHPVLAKIYWPFSAASRIFKEKGIRGLVKRLLKRRRR